MRAVVYTAISGQYDTLKGCSVNDAEYHALIEPQFYPHSDPCRRSKFPKVNSHLFETEYSMWCDGSVRFDDELNFQELIDTYLTSTDIAVMMHPLRDCIYEEGAACIALEKDSPILINEQLERYRIAGHPAHWGLAETCIILRRHTPQVIYLNQLWWNEIEKGSRRDQLSFPYVLRQVGLQCLFIPGRPFFTVEPHLIVKPKRRRRKGSTKT